MSMRILPLNNISFKSNNVQAKESEKSLEEKSKGLSNSAKLGIGLLGSAALGVATYYIFKGKNLSGTTRFSLFNFLDKVIHADEFFRYISKCFWIDWFNSLIFIIS